MRKSPIKELLEKRGAQFGNWSGVETVLNFGSFEREYQAVRNGVGLSDFSFTTRFKVPEAGLDMLDTYAAGSVAGIRYGRVLHTFAADEAGFLQSDLYIANDDEEFIIIGENIIDDADVSTALNSLGAREANLEDISNSTALFGLDGYKAWAVAKDLFGADVLGLPYMSLETYELEDMEVKLIRGGKTSEFGYLFLVQEKHAGVLWEKIEKAGRPYGLEPVGIETHLGLRLDGRFFSIQNEGKRVKDPLALGLQWMIDLEGDDFRGKSAILERRSAGLKNKIIGIIPSSHDADLSVDSGIYHEKTRIGTIVATTPSPALGHPIGLALVDLDFAYAGLEYEDSTGKSIRTISMPPFTAKSLTVKLDEM